MSEFFTILRKDQLYYINLISLSLIYKKGDNINKKNVFNDLRVGLLYKVQVLLYIVIIERFLKQAIVVM